MTGSVYDQFMLIVTSAVIALSEPTDQFHEDASAFVHQDTGFVWFTVNATAHEVFTRVRYDKGLRDALARFDLLRGPKFRILRFDDEDEQRARKLLKKYRDQTIDALCAVMMLRYGIYRIFSFDRDFWSMGFQVMPGRTS